MNGNAGDSLYDGMHRVDRTEMPAADTTALIVTLRGRTEGVSPYSTIVLVSESEMENLTNLFSPSYSLSKIHKSQYFLLRVDYPYIVVVLSLNWHYRVLVQNSVYVPLY